MRVDQTILPLQHAPRKLAVHLKDQVRERIEQMEQMGVIEKVMDPSDWISSMVVVQRPGKLRICIDPKYWNHALK